MDLTQSHSGLRAIILDWAGTTVDHGSLAPVVVMLQLFKQYGVEIKVEEARHSMGRLKKDHIRDICSLPRVRDAWASSHGSQPSESDVESLFASFAPLQMACLLEYSHVISGVAESVAHMRRRGCKIGSTTGYTREMLAPLLVQAAREGFAPDVSVTPDEVNGGRPLPFMVYRAAILLREYPLWAFVKIGDTVPDIEEGRNAGMWTIGITRTGNELGLSLEELDRLPGEEAARRVARAEERLLAAGAHAVAESIARVHPALDEIELRLRNGQRP